jgi:hypothetical protein
LQDLDVIFPGIFPPQRICIVGAGHFGYLAAQRLNHRFPEATFLVVDERREKLDRVAEDLKIAVLREDTLSFLENAWVDERTWIIPAVPIHFAFQWLLHELKKLGGVEHLSVPALVKAQIPNPYLAPSGSFCASFATFICPDICNEPDEICTHTKGPRPGNLFEELAKINVPNFDVLVIRSWQLAPGVGGYPRGSVRKVRERIAENGEGRYLIATSCRCHGVIDALAWKRGAGVEGRRTKDEGWGDRSRKKGTAGPKGRRLLMDSGCCLGSDAAALFHRC